MAASFSPIQLSTLTDRHREQIKSMKIRFHPNIWFYHTFPLLKKGVIHPQFKKILNKKFKLQQYENVKKWMCQILRLLCIVRHYLIKTSFSSIWSITKRKISKSFKRLLFIYKSKLNYSLCKPTCNIDLPSIFIYLLFYHNYITLSFFILFYFLNI